MKRLNKLIRCKYNTPIYGVKTNSKDVVKGDLFVAVHGMNIDHHDYIFDAIDKGAVAIISEKEINTNIPVIIVKNTNKALKRILEKYYDNIQNEFKFIGITGTDGKTTTSTIISYILEEIFCCANIGTNGLKYKKNKKILDNTTPDSDKLYEYLLELNKLGCKYVSMEVSSEALLHKRVDNIKYNVGIITNITEDHLNIHKSIDNYVKSKSKLFSLIDSNGFAILNIDDKFYNDILKKCKSKVYTYGFNKNSDFRICNDAKMKSSGAFKIIYDEKEFLIEHNFIGTYNIYNLTAAFACTYLLGVEPEYILKRIKELCFIPGRCEKIDFGQDFTIILDYAHTENAIKNILSTFFTIKKNRIISVTGSAGGREKEKRKKIGKIITKMSDLVIFTEDDPRDEDVLDIIDDMLEEVRTDNFLIVEDRESAIYKAFSIAEKDDIVLILGKGRDNYMAKGKEKIKYSDYDTIKTYFENE